MILSLAIRNILANKSRTIVVGLLILFCSSMVFWGSSFLQSLSTGLMTNYLDHYTGHVIIQPQTDEGLQGLERQVDSPIMNHDEELSAYLESHDQVQSYHRQLSGTITLHFDGVGQAFTEVRGIEPQDYEDFFPRAFEYMNGRFLNPQEEGIVLSQRVQESIQEELGITLRPGNTIKISYAGQQGLKIREILLVGIASYQSSTLQRMGLSLMDRNTLESLYGFPQGSTEDLHLSEMEMNSLFEEDILLGDFFGSDLMEESQTTDKADDIASLFAMEAEHTEELQQVQHWHYSLLRLENASEVDAFIEEFNLHAQAMDWALEAADWEVAAGSLAQFSRTFRILFQAVMLILTVVSVIVITNTLVISVLTRTREIGTMRAIGSHKSFVRRLFMGETFMLTAAAGLGGILVGLAIVLILSLRGIPLGNDLLVLLLGEPVLRPELQWSSFTLSLVYLGLVGFLSSIYPVSLALKVSPLKAIED